VAGGLILRGDKSSQWLLQTQDRVGSRQFLLKQEFLAIMLGVRRRTVTLVMGTLQDAGLIASRYGCIRLATKKQDASCECYEVIRGHFRRLGL
jgi:CRP-like cAMP-binding protein